MEVLILCAIYKSSFIYSNHKNQIMMYHDQRTVKAASSGASKWHNANNTGTRPTSTSEMWFPAWKYSDLIIIINERASRRKTRALHLFNPPLLCSNSLFCSVLALPHTHTNTHARTHARYFSGIWIFPYRRKAANLNISEKQNQPKPQCWFCDKSGMVAYSSLKCMKSTGWSH